MGIFDKDTDDQTAGAGDTADTGDAVLPTPDEIAAGANEPDADDPADTPAPELAEYYLGQVDFDRLEVEAVTTSAEAEELLRAKTGVLSADEQRALQHLAELLD